MRRRKLRLGARRIKPGQHRGPRHETEALQENALWQRAMRHGAGRARGCSEGRKIHMRGDIHLTGCAERINRLARVHGLQAITKTAFRWPVINQQSRAAMARAAAAYYATRDPFQDFATSPEISQAFGECLGLWAAVTWQAMGRPDPVLLVECGPGRGSLMADALRAISEMMPDFRAALRVHLVETSPRLREAQAAKLGDAGVTWHEDVGALPEAPMILLANEFLDALPIRQFIRRGAAWYERFVADGAFVEVPSDITLTEDY